MLYRTSHQMLKVSRAGEDQELALLLNMLRVGWRITDVIVLPTNKTVVYFRRRVWCRPIRFLLRASLFLSSRKRSYAVRTPRTLYCHPMAIRDTITEISKRLFGSLGDAALDGGFDVVRKVIDDTSSEREEIQKLRDYYDGYQIRGRGLQKGKKYVSLWPGEDDADLDTRADRMEQISWNRIRDGVNTHADALYAWGKGRAVSRDIVWDDSEVESEEDRAWWEEFYRKRFLEINNFPRLAWEVWNKAGAERHALGMLRWMDGSSRRLEKFTRDALDRATHRERGVVWVEILDPLHYVALPHPDQTSTLGAVIRWYLDPEYEWGRQISSNLVPTPGQDNTITELVTDRLWLRWKGRALTPHQWGMTNRYGDVRTLFVLAKNPGMVADSEDALKAQTSLNEHLYSGSEIKRQHAFPETLYRGYEPPMREDSQGNKVLDRGPCRRRRLR